MLPYAISTRALRHRTSLPPGTRVVPGAATLARLWGRSDGPRIDARLGPADVVHATNFLVPPSRHPTIATIHDCSPVRHPSLCIDAVRALVPSLRRAIDRGVHVHVPSEFVADEVEELFGPGLHRAGRLHVVHWGVPALPAAGPMPTELAAFGPIANGMPFVLAIGTLEPRKNLAHLVAAFAAPAGRDRDLHLVLAGPDGPARPEIDAAIARLGPETASRVVLTGAVSDMSKAWLLRHARALAYPSIYEGFGFPVLEAMSTQTPVLAARAGSIPEIVGDAAVLVDATDEHAMADALERLTHDETVRDDLVRKGSERVRAFSWTESATSMAALYRTVAR
jgi:glycosyltransferase involved in cell wall biosynthesis